MRAEVETRPVLHRCESLPKKKNGHIFRVYNHFPSCEDQREEGLNASNFQSFLNILEHCIGGDAVQGNILGRQVDVSPKLESDGNLVEDLGITLVQQTRSLLPLVKEKENNSLMHFGGHMQR